MAKELEKEMAAAGVEVLRVGPGMDRRAIGSTYSRLRASMDGSIGVDCEGTHGHTGANGPLMVQVASKTVAVVEVPQKPGQYSLELRELLADAGIQKVFCQGKGDIAAFGKCSPPLDVGVCFVDLKDMTDLPKNPSPGLAAVLSRADPQGVRWSKQSFNKRRWWTLQSSKAMLAEPGFVSYAAADAWGTLLAHDMLTGQAVRSPDKANSTANRNDKNQQTKKRKRKKKKQKNEQEDKEEGKEDEEEEEPRLSRGAHRDASPLIQASGTRRCLDALGWACRLCQGR
ncbi:PPEF2 [Symbiodinium natans]|uniref:PPEF2 protein n=1 Tax=Symbiodinium natans TaxID=878477 RepID=A0A812Q1J4_9DINO|nr:PPEF2 [Symbiodinium natans]